MSVRSLRLCDKPGCDLVFSFACVFCDTDCCVRHTAGSEVQTTVVLRLSRGELIRVAVARYTLCVTCSDALKHSGEPSTADLSNDTFAASVVEVCKARMVAQALAAKGPDGDS